MDLLTPLNIEQSITRYLADTLTSNGYKVYWYDSRQEEGAGNTTVSIVRSFPSEPTNFIPRDGTQKVGLVKVPAISVFCEPGTTDEINRLGLGEGLFNWSFEVRTEFITDLELEWYTFSNKLVDWLGNPDVRIEVLDYDDDLSDPTPSSTSEHLQLVGTDVFREYLGENSALQYYINLRATATIPG